MTILNDARMYWQNLTKLIMYWIQHPMKEQWRYLGRKCQAGSDKSIEDPGFSQPILWGAKHAKNSEMVFQLMGIIDIKNSYRFKVSKSRSSDVWIGSEQIGDHGSIAGLLEISTFRREVGLKLKQEVLLLQSSIFWSFRWVAIGLSCKCQSKHLTWMNSGGDRWWHFTFCLPCCFAAVVQWSWPLGFVNSFWKGKIDCLTIVRPPTIESWEFSTKRPWKKQNRYHTI